MTAAGFLDFSLGFTFLVLTLAFALIIVRIVRGPSLPDRILALDLLVAVAIGYIAAFAISLGPVMWVLFLEIFPNRVRGFALAFCGVFNSVASFFVQFLFPWGLANLGNAATFYVFAFMGVVGVVLIQWLLPETKGKSLEELEAVMAR